MNTNWRHEMPLDKYQELVKETEKEEEAEEEEAWEEYCNTRILDNK